MAVFRLDKDQFRRQVAELVKAGDKYEDAQNELSFAVGQSCKDLQSNGVCAPSNDDDRWSNLDELRHLRTPVHASLAAVDKELKHVSEQQHKVIADLRASLSSFDFRDDAERNEFVKILDKLDRKFTYVSPEGMNLIGNVLSKTPGFDSLIDGLHSSSSAQGSKGSRQGQKSAGGK